LQRARDISGKELWGQQIVVTGLGGKTSFFFEASRRLTSGERVTATATDSVGSASEFSDPRTVTPAPGLG